MLGLPACGSTSTRLAASYRHVEVGKQLKSGESSPVEFTNGISYYFPTMRLRTFLIAFLLLLYVTAPVIDAVACDDCAETVPTNQRAGDILQPLPDLAEKAGHGENHASPSRGTAKDLCPLCANAVVGIVTMTCPAPFDTTQSVGQPKLLAFSDPSYTITKPPQN